MTNPQLPHLSLLSLLSSSWLYSTATRRSPWRGESRPSSIWTLQRCCWIQSLLLFSKFLQIFLDTLSPRSFLLSGVVKLLPIVLKKVSALDLGNVVWYSVSFYFLSRLHFLQHDWNWRGEWGDQTCSDLCPRLGRNRLKLYNPSTGFVHLLFNTFDSSQDQNYREEYIITQDCLVGNGKMVTSWPGKGPNFSLVTRSPDLKLWFWKTEENIYFHRTAWLGMAKWRPCDRIGGRTSTPHKTSSSMWWVFEE